MEDVQDALRRGIAAERSFLFLVDSAMRDRGAYPTPSDYYIPFPQPFRNVFALDLVDATIPRTEYSVESLTNTLVYAPGTWANYEAARLAGETVSVRLEPGNYNVVQLIDALGKSLNAAAIAKGHLPVRVESVGDPVDLTNKIRFFRTEPFSIFMDQTTMRDIVGFGLPSLSGLVGWDGSARYATDSSVKNDVYHSVPKSTTGPLPTFPGPVDVRLPEYAIPLTNPVTAVRQTFTAQVSGRLSGISVKGSANDDVVLTVIVTDTALTTIGSCSITATASNGTWTGTFPISSGDILEGDVYIVSISAAADDKASLYKSEVFTDDAANLIETESDALWTTYSTTDALCFDLSVSISGHQIEAPGQCSLVGERYVLVRSPDIEQHMNRDFAVAFDRMSPGLGMLKLGGIGYREERFNFLAYQTRRFHPIGKLKGIRIRLETRAGRLYDSHGIDHTLLLCVKMYAPGPSTAIPRTLYPAYDPDPRLALVKKLEKDRRN